MNRLWLPRGVSKDPENTEEGPERKARTDKNTERRTREINNSKKKESHLNIPIVLLSSLSCHVLQFAE